ncbi:unnamed protein product [Cladocopium goreaui]|uniref:RNA cytidine acetyltransferase (18S rRNA cytosin e acetyltransferase) (Killer toxin-resistance protein 33) (Ribosomal RNA cytidine acetyltransferase 1) n=1 Tax=Cladocopium goreaui TaxID=2562237 RepID=A0A9P1D7U9_9DINO|nr:unnamed protein product [Cladocopium goreaui]
MAVSKYDEKPEAAEASETQNPEVADEPKNGKKRDTEEMQHEKGEDREDALQEPGSLDAKTLSLAVCAVLEGKDLDTVSLKDFRLALEQHLDLKSGALESRKEEINELVKAEIGRPEEKPRRTQAAARTKRKAAQVDWRRSVRRAEKAPKASEEKVEGENPLDQEERKDPALDMPPSMPAQISGQDLQLTGKTFASGTFGYHGCAGLVVEIGGQRRSMMCQISCALLNESTTVGILIAGLAALSRRLRAIVIAAPAVENVSELLGWARRGLTALGQGCLNLDPRGSFCTTRPEDNSDTSTLGICDDKAVQGCQQGCQVLVSDLATAPQLLFALAGMGHEVVVVCDEAASVEIPVIKSILAAPSRAVIMAGTTSSCEGTGSALEWKLLLDTAGATGFKQTRLFLKEPIRYGSGCPLEELLDSMLFLGATGEHPLHELGNLAELGPEATKLLQLDPASFTASTEFSKALVAVLQTHYRTSASDISMITQKYTRTMVLVPDGSIEGLRCPLPLVVLLCILEAPELSQLEENRGSSRLSRSHLMTFCIEQDFPEMQLSGLRGLRVARVVCDPRLRGCGFGSEAIRQLVAHLTEANLHMLEPGDSDKISGLGPLQLEPCAWLGASFGLTAPLLRFWSRLGLQPVALSPVWPSPFRARLQMCQRLCR